MTEAIEQAVAETPAPEAAPAEIPAETTVESTQDGQEAQTGRPARDALSNAMAAVDARMAEKKEAADRERNPDGTFKASETGEPADVQPEPEAEATETESEPEPEKVSFDGPERFSQEAKEAWKGLPDVVKSEVRRLESELSNGMEKYREDATRFEEYRGLADNLKQQGRSIAEVMNHYSGIETTLRRDPIAGLDQICRNIGTTLQDVVAHVGNQPVEESARQQNTLIDGLRSELGAIKGELAKVTTSITDKQTMEATQLVTDFQKTHPRFEELANDIKFFLQAGRATDLQGAYSLAERLNPAPEKAPAKTVQTDQAAQTRDQQALEAQPLDKGRLSVNGAPTNGSNPNAGPSRAERAKEPVMSSIQRAFSKTRARI